MQNIQIKILNDKEFDRLPPSATRGADISDSVAFADVDNKRIYVRDYGRDDLNKLVVQHELEHLFELEGTHEDEKVPGIRHKKKSFWNFIAPGAGAIGGGGSSPSPIPSAQPIGIFDLFSGGGSNQQPQQEPEQQQQMVTEQQNSSLTGPLGQFQVSEPGTSKVPTGTGGGGTPALQGGVNNGIVQNGQQTQLSPELQSRVKGFFSGRAAF